MYKLVNYIGMSLLLAFGAACEKQYTLYDDLTPPSALGGPADGVVVDIAPASGAPLIFEWDEGKASDGGVVLYEVIFDRPEGDFSAPVYKVLADNGGVSTTLSLDHGTLNRAASAAGIGSLETGDLQWTVLASKGTNRLRAPESRSITVTRPMGFANVPADVWLTGSATEAGAEMSEALPMKKVEDGVFEIYTSLKAGSYQLLSGTEGEADRYYVGADGIVHAGTGESTVTADLAVYHVLVDFNNATASLNPIHEVELFMSAYNASIGTLQYAGYGTWRGENIPVEFFPFSWGRDERYKFRLSTGSGTLFMGSEQANNGSPVGAPANYFYVYPVNSDQWEHTYKFDPAADNGHIDVELSLVAGQPYTHRVTVR